MQKTEASYTELPRLKKLFMIVRGMNRRNTPTLSFSVQTCNPNDPCAPRLRLPRRCTSAVCCVHDPHIPPMCNVRTSATRALPYLSAKPRRGNRSQESLEPVKHMRLIVCPQRPRWPHWPRSEKSGYSLPCGPPNSHCIHAESVPATLKMSQHSARESLPHALYKACESSCAFGCLAGVLTAPVAREAGA
ncbi:hypothetical protein OH76DRAFT_397996 [Lentinus brumalis]|uniref:Uncharacterized protein n=1 Tax=Lentinus brumalis TaxID=2498619 RepID=A0A371DVJ0_9APHY|nr:hypothetical protein OH76DRAFT_397996 [Polyporus brumalis]